MPPLLRLFGAVATMKRMEKRIGQKLEAMGVMRGERLGIAVSGGVDSMVLLHCVCLLRQELNMTVVAYHMEHGIRAKQSLEDMRFVQRVCEEYGVECIAQRADVPALAASQGVSLETAARQARYAFLDKQQADHIATAHHMDDLAETVVMNLIRGSGTRGLCGIPAVRGRYIRPMLDIARQEIEAYAKKMNIAFVHDETNEDAAYTRNYVRKEIMPRLCAVNAQAVAHIAQAAALLWEDDTALEHIALKAGGIADVEDGCEIAISTLLAQMPAVQKRMVRSALEMYFGLCDVGFVHVNAVLELAQKGQSGKRVDIGNGIAAAVAYGKLRLFRCVQKEAADVAFTGPGRYEIGSAAFLCTHHDGEMLHQDNTEYFDADALDGACFRYRREGDVICPLGLGGTKRLSDYLSDRKIPLHMRDALVLLAKGNHVFWVAGVGVSDTSKAKPGSRLYKIEIGENTHA